MKKLINYGLVMVLILGISLSCKKTAVIDDVPDNLEDAINILAKDLDGNDFSLNSFKGKVIMITFSAYWCGPCRSETRELPGFYNKYKNQGFEIVQVLMEDESGRTADLSDIKRWAAEFGINFTLLYDEDESSSSDYNIRSIPTNIIIDKDFKVRKILTGFSGIEELENAIKDLL